MPTTMRRPTQKDVAARAGVTRAVVSHVLYGRVSTIRVSAQTAQRVRDAAHELGYRPNVSARNLRSQRTRTIGVLHGDGFPRLHFTSSSYFAALMDGIVEGAFRHGYTVALCPKLFSQTPEDAMADGRFDGLVWYSTFPSPSNSARLRRCSVPIAIVHSRVDDFDGRFPTAVCDNEGGIRLALAHLAELGHRRVAFAYDDEYLFGESGIRRDAFLRIAPEYGMVASLIDVRGDQSGLGRYLSMPPPHTAIIAQNDELAVDVLRGLLAAGFSVPRDLSVVGFDSTDRCLMSTPRLTAVSQPIASLGFRAVEALVDVIEGRVPTPFESIFSCGLDIRESTGPARME